MPEEEPEQYIVLPERGLFPRPEDREAARALRSLGTRGTRGLDTFEVSGRPGEELRVVDSIREDGPKLVEVTRGAVRALRGRQLGVRLEPVREYRPATVPAFAPNPPPLGAGAAAVTVEIVSAADGSPVEGATVTAFTSFAANLGAQGTTDANGRVQLAVGSPASLDRFYVVPPLAGFWGMFRSPLTVRSGDVFRLNKVDPGFVDALRHFYGTANLTEGSGVKVGVVDTGIDFMHPDLRVSGGRNTAQGEASSDFDDNGMGHGTHVAGIIAARGTPPQGLRGLAPEVELRSYRVFGKGKGTSTTFSIVKALIFAMEDDCDLINLSIAGVPRDEVLRQALEEVKDRGGVVVAAAGNEGRKAVGIPAAYGEGFAVSAIGRKNCFPPESREHCEVDANPPGTDPDNFVASFTNVGQEISLTAPGVGILSTVPGGGYGPMSGTSMACPAVTGMAARLLAKNPATMSMPRDANRARAILVLVDNAAQPLGFGTDFEGSGMPR